jgi:CBS domain containing-hemolysin-like protein
MGASLWLVLLGLLVCAAAAVFFAIAEASLFALGKWQARQLVERSPFSGALVKGLLEQPSRVIAAMAIGSTAAHFGVIWFGFWPVLQGKWPWLGTGLGLFALMLGIEAVAKIAAGRHAESWSLRFAPVLTVFHKVVCWISIPLQEATEWTIRRVVPKSIRPQTGLSDDEYKELLELAHDQGAIARSERDIILQIISLDRKTVGDVMRPRTQIAAVSDDASIEEMIAAARKHKHRRLPIYDDTLDTIVGVLNTRRLLLNPEIDLSEAIEFPSNVPESMNLLLLLKSLQRQQRGMAIVLDEFGGTAGLVTVEDILEEVVGEIRDRDEPAEFVIEKLATGGWKVSGTTPIEKFRIECPDIGAVPDVETVGGLVVKLFEVVPAAGQSTTYRNLRLTAQQTDDRRVREVVVEPLRKR